MTIGERIKQLRTDKNLTQPQLAELANIEQSYLSKLENDKSIPSPEILIGLLRALDIDIQTFLHGIDEKIVQRHLLQIPEIAVHLNVESRLRVRQVKRWLLGSAISCALGFALIFGGLNQLLFGPVYGRLYQYVSPGIILAGEPEDLFERGESDARNRIMLGQSVTPELVLKAQLAAEEFRKRLNTDIKQSIEYRGQEYRVDVQGGYRLYKSKGDELHINQTYLRANNWFSVLGAFLGLCGILGFVVEFRLRKL